MVSCEGNDENDAKPHAVLPEEKKSQDTNGYQVRLQYIAYFGTTYYISLFSRRYIDPLKLSILVV
jgi:hypothetical protein